MQNSFQNITPEIILEIVLRRRWFLILPMIVALTVGIYMALTLPRMYKASTLILVQPPSVPRTFVRPVISTSIESRIATISQQILSRTNLEKIMQQFKLFQGPAYRNMYIEDKIAGLRKRIGVDVTRIRSGADAFSISYEGKEPETVMQVANTLATYFIDQNLKVRESQAMGTSTFLSGELQIMKARLVKTEDALRNYRERYMGGLPEQLDSNLEILGQLQKQLNEKQKALQESKAALLANEAQLAQAKTMASEMQMPAIDIGDTGDAADTGDSSQLGNLKAKLAQALLVYTDRYPDVVRLKRMIADLEAKDKKAAAKAPAKKAEEPMPSLGLGINFQDVQRSQLNGMKQDIANNELAVKQLAQKIAIYQKRVEDTPQRETEMIALNRNYKNIKSTYDSLLNRDLEAQIAVNMEKQQKGEQFQILDPAQLPQKPVSPDMKRLFALSLAAGLAVGGGIIFLLEYLDTTLRRPEDIETALGLPVLAAVPSIFKPGKKTRVIAERMLSAVSVMVILMLVAVLAVLMSKGVDQTIAAVRNYIPL